MPQDTPPASTKRVGLIGGLAFRAGIFYYERILERCTARNRRLELVLAHADLDVVLAFVAAGNRPALGGYLGDFANQLFAAGAELVSVGAVAPHLAFDELVSVARGPMVSALDTIVPGMRTAGLEKVAVFGNGAVMATGVFGRLPPSMVAPLDPSELAEVHAAYSGIAAEGKRGDEAETRLLEHVARRLIGQRGAQAILLAGTDLSSFYADRPPSFPYLDVAALHMDEIVRRACTD